MRGKILVDSISLLSPLTGIGRYTYEISKYLDPKSRNFFYGYYSKKLIEPSSGKDIKKLKSFIIKYPIIKRVARKLLRLSSQIFKPSYDIYWQPNFIPNSGIKAKKIVTTVHDFSFILHKDFHPKERIEYFENNFFQNIYKSDFIITGSNFSKEEILDRLDFDKSKIRVIYHGIEHNIFKVKESIDLDIKLPSKFIFSVGSIEPRKNLLGLLKAYDNFSNNFKDEYKLVLAGFKGWENSEVMEIIDENRDNIEYLGFVSDDELASLYNLASLFIFPSFYEGFGLPVLEAMACGTPVVCSDSSSLPEVGGDAVIYCNPHSIDDIKEKIEFVLNDTNLQKNMIAKGLVQAKKFSWEKSANEHITLFKSLI
ncbi:Glycosyl transferase, group 1 [hydrothermal vent metagenome]|uniref:Glycosyl transferase, group 1 n=1 Tax=hydrothermal vent metagenome TaxID=652676 RepID=A0A1W1EHX2_9ZZZZ